MLGKLSFGGSYLGKGNCWSYRMEALGWISLIIGVFY